MPGTNKVAISLPCEIFDAIEQERKESGESRSELFRRAIEMLLRRRQEEEKVRQYIRGYELMPESAEEITATDLAAAAMLAVEPW